MNKAISFFREWWFHILMPIPLIAMYLFDAPGWNYLVVISGMLISMGLMQQSVAHKDATINLLIKCLREERKRK
jgi:hypothetical protein